MRSTFSSETSVANTTPAGTIDLLSFSTGGKAGYNKVVAAKKKDENQPGLINTGIGAFFNQPICFDLTNKVIRFPQQS